VTERIARFLSRRWRVPESVIRVEVLPLDGGLESRVTRAKITHASDAALPRRLVVKELGPGLEREARVYDALWRHMKRPPSVRVFGRESSAHATYLYMEDAQPACSWPWSDVELAAAVCREVARFHDQPDLPREHFAWNYEAVLALSAETTLQVAIVARDLSGQRYWRRLGDLRRVVAALPRIRQCLLSGATTLIHGDLHPGNVILRDRPAGFDVVLLDWARARVGSPLEDVASWLHSLGCWEPQARRRHDTLMRAYLEARAVRHLFSTDVRHHYWLASASNGLGGAIRYHLSVAADKRSSDSSRDHSRRALVAWERVVRKTVSIVCQPQAGGAASGRTCEMFSEIWSRRSD
jgi:hypothetical protein